MKGIILFAIGLLVFITIILMIIFHNAVRAWKIFRSSAERNAERASRKAAKEEEYFRRTSSKQYRPEENKPKFDKDYFKSTDEGKDKQDQSQRKGQQQQKEQQRTSRTTTTSEGVTIIDHRDQSSTSRKIFSDNEGEYTDFEEV